MRRGNYADFDPTKMLSGEFAVCLDNGYVYITLSPGNVIRLGTAEAIERLVSLAQQYEQQSEAWAKGTKDGTAVPSTDPAYENNAKFFKELAAALTQAAESSAQDSEAYAIGQRDGSDVPSTDPAYENNSKYYAEQAEGYKDYVEEAVETHMPEFEIDWTTGELLYSGGYFTFWVDENGFLRWGVETEGSGS